MVIWIGKKVKCPECGTYNDKENAVAYNSRYYCKVCFANRTRDAEDYKDLIAYICDLYCIEAPTGWMLKQIKDFKEQYKYTYKGMKSTLHYFYEILEGNDTANSIGIGIIPFVYDEAKKFYVDKKAVKDSVLGCDLEDIENNKRVVHINRKDYQKNNDYKRIALIDIEQL